MFGMTVHCTSIKKLQENVWSFWRAAKKSGRNNEVNVTEVVVGKAGGGGGGGGNKKLFKK